VSTLLKTVAVEGKLFLREPMSVIFGVLFPTVILLGLGAVPVLREPSEDFDGARFIEFWAPTALVLGLAVLGLQHIPGVLASYRENGVLRRVSTTPVHPGVVLTAQLAVALAAALVAAVLLVATGALVLDIPLPAHPVQFTVAFLLGYCAVLALGLLIAAVAPNARVAGGLATVVFMLVMFAGGVYLPRFLMPDFLLRLGDYVPPGVQALLDAWSGERAIQPVPLGIMALVAVGAGWAAAKLFRWE
jgi:ABC-2 type transport system permease protein